MIYAYGLADPDQSDITYHESRRGTRMIPLRSYSKPPPEEKFADLDQFELRLNNVSYTIELILFKFHSLFLSMLFHRMTQHIIVKFTKYQLCIQRSDMLLLYMKIH